MSNQENINVTLDSETKELIVRHGQAQSIKEPESLIINGSIESISEYLGKRNISQKETFIYVNFNETYIKALIGEKDPYPTEIKGKLETSKEIEEWGVNMDKQMLPKEWAVFMKKRLFYFNNKENGRKVISELMRFKGDVEKHVEDNDDKKGNQTYKYEQAIKTNLPESFSLRLPFFKDDNLKKIDVEFVVDPDALYCTLISENLFNEYQHEIRQKIEDQVQDINEKFPSIPIIYC